MKISTKIAATVIALCSAATAAAAPATIRSSIDSTTMTMGNKTMIRVAVVKDKSQAGHLIAPQDSIVNEVEVAGEISHSVADLGNGRFDDGLQTVGRGGNGLEDGTAQLCGEGFLIDFGFFFGVDIAFI